MKKYLFWYTLTFFETNSSKLTKNCSNSQYLRFLQVPLWFVNGDVKYYDRAL